MCHDEPNTPTLHLAIRQCLEKHVLEDMRSLVNALGGEGHPQGLDVERCDRSLESLTGALTGAVVAFIGAASLAVAVWLVLDARHHHDEGARLMRHKGYRR